MRGIVYSKEKKEYVINDLEIFQISSKDIILEIKNRLEFILDKTAISKRKLSHILDKPDEYIAHRFSYNDKLNMTVFIEIIKIFRITPHTFFLPKKEEFLAIFNDNQIAELKNNAQLAYKAIEIRQIKKETKEIMRRLNNDRNLENCNKIVLLNKLMRKLVKLKEILETKKSNIQLDGEIASFEMLLKKVITNIEKTKAQLQKLKG